MCAIETLPHSQEHVSNHEVLSPRLKGKNGLCATEILRKTPEELAAKLIIPSAIVTILVLPTTEITLSCKPPVRLKLQLNLWQNTSLNLIVIIALQNRAMPRHRCRSLPRARPHPCRSLQNLELLTLAIGVLSLAEQPPSKLSQNVHVLTCQIGRSLTPPVAAWRAQLSGEAGPEMLILRCDDIQNMAVNGDSERFEVCEGLQASMLPRSSSSGMQRFSSTVVSRSWHVGPISSRKTANAGRVAILKTVSA